jgi:hypothetical protein
MRQTSASSLLRSIWLVGPPLALSLGCPACSSSTADSGVGVAGAAPEAGASSLPGAAGAAVGAGGAPVSGGSGAPAVAGGASDQSGGGGVSPSGGSSTGGVPAMAGTGGAGAMAGSLAGAGAGGAASSSGAPTHNELILYDDNGGNLLYVNNTKPSANWTTNSGSGRDLQLIGGGLVMLGKSDGWDEYRLSDGMKSGGVHGLKGTQAVHRLADGTTVLATAQAAGIRAQPGGYHRADDEPDYLSRLYVRTPGAPDLDRNLPGSGRYPDL